MKQKNVFTYWSGPKSPLIAELEELMILHSKNNYDLHLLNETNVAEYISVPENFSSLTPVEQSDFIRVAVICEYGGIWLDADTLVMGSLDPLFEYLESNDGFFMLENNRDCVNGVFGSNKHTKFMTVWSGIIQIVTSNLTPLAQYASQLGLGNWGINGVKVISALHSSGTPLMHSYEFLKGLDNIYPVNYTDLVEEFATKPYENYKHIEREFQPLIVLGNSLYRHLENLTQDELREMDNALAYFLKTSREAALSN
ncbi:capsular polysaccharide synthesis protein [Pseudoalteromonas luteoviolacea]|uniref:Alpha 1,4-glycosyltransferase domain-containing protein n=1 Tax=Pseudoalteromonas luteoviolacea S4060-1 TaxID=1365257 RepID=A0A161YUM6_9GAMM|nr:capsular polysaccharide synthesis protein [Pseudoalteromonas luteoviolacea]KZN66260.1 hypothetical protein N478_20300 [Pseudoalteromonas luteoviolacea S4060-1]